MNDYEKLLEEAYEKVKPITEAKDRFEVPRAQITIEGNKTIILNFVSIISYIRRTPEHVQKFMGKELAVPVQKEGDRLVMIGKLPQSKIHEKIDQYIREYVICKECKKPDTELRQENRITIMHCLACGAKHPVRG